MPYTVRPHTADGSGLREHSIGDLYPVVLAAEPVPGGGVKWRVWYSGHESVAFEDKAEARRIAGALKLLDVHLGSTQTQKYFMDSPLYYSGPVSSRRGLTN